MITLARPGIETFPHIVVIAASITLLFTRPVQSQAVAIDGTVTDMTGLPVAGAEVSIRAQGVSTITDTHGGFRLQAATVVPSVLHVRRLGFHPDSTRLSVPYKSSGALLIRLKPIASELKPITVKASRGEYSGRLAGYYSRLEKRNGAVFITRDEIDAGNSRSLSQLLQRSPSMRGVRGRGGAAGIRMRGRSCAPLVWLDGVQLPAGEFDLDGVPPSTLHGIELYMGSSSAPTRYTTGVDFSGCGTILLWSRGPDTDPIRSRDTQRWNLDALVASLAVYTADQVDQPAVLEPAGRADITYPPELFAEKVEGKVVAEFIVDTAGKVEQGTFGIVSSTHDMFSESVRKAAGTATYKPAIKGGIAVRQIVHQPYSFSVSGRGAP